MSRLILDVETYPLDDAAQFIEEPEAPSNWKDPEKIAAYVKEARQKAVGRCALDVDLCRVVCACTIDADNGVLTTSVARNDDEEYALLLALGKAISAYSQIVGFNILDFDLPVLIRRAQYLNVDFPKLSLDRYRTPHLDLMQFLSFNGKLKFRGQAFYKKRFGLDIPDETSGKDIAAMVQASDWDGVAAHCVADVRTVAALAQRLGLIPGEEVA